MLLTRRTKILKEKPAIMPLYPPETLRELAWDRSWASVVVRVRLWFTNCFMSHFCAHFHSPKKIRVRFSNIFIFESLYIRIKIL